MTADETVDATNVDEAKNVTDESVDEVTANDDAAVETKPESESESRDGRLRRSPRMTWARVGVILLAVVLVASAGVAMWLYFKQYRPDQ